MVLPVLFIVIVIFGHGKDKFKSALLFFLYTLAGSLPMLLSILTIYSYIGSTDFQFISLNKRIVVTALEERRSRLVTCV